MTQTIRLEIDLAVDHAGNIQVEATNLKRLSSASDRKDSDQAICFLTGQPKVTCVCSECTKSSSHALVTNQPKDQYQIEVVFTHPRDPGYFTAIVSSDCTGEQAVAGLVLGDEKGPFLEPAPPGRPYLLALMSSGVSILPNVTFEDAGVVDGDKIEVRQAGQGGGVPWNAIQLSLAYGVGTGAGLAFVKAIAPILQQMVKNKGSRSVEVEVAGKRIKIVGKNSIKEVIAAIRELAEMYGLNESSESKEPRNRRAKKEARKLKSRATKVRQAGRRGSKPSRSPQLDAGKGTNKIISVREKRKKNSRVN